MLATTRLRLCRPLAFLDVETTGTSPASDRIVEIAVLKLWPDGREEMRCRRVNPGCPIPPEATAIHGITDADVAGEPPFRAYARALFELLAECDYAGYNLARFDLPFLREEFRREGFEFSWQGRAVIDAMSIFHRKEPRDLMAAVRFYCGGELANPHSAREDVLATRQVLLAQLARYADLPPEVDALHEAIAPVGKGWVDGEGKLIRLSGAVCLGFGKYRGAALASLARDDPSYLDWILNGDFSDEVKRYVRDALASRAPQHALAGTPAS